MADAVTSYRTNQIPEVEWLGPIPNHWAVKKLKYTIATLESGVSVNATDLPAEDKEVGVLKTSCVYTGEFRASENKTVVPNELGRVKCPVREQAIIISRMNTPDLVGASGLVTEPHDNLFLPDRLWQTVFRPEAIVAARYMAYFLGTEGFRKQISLAAEGASSSMQNVAKPDFLAIHTAVPPLEEQTQIAKFLDYETAKIDALIEKQQQLIALLKEKRQAVISHAVTKGLNPDAPMRDSGVEWLGEVPAHWEVKRIKNLAAIISKGTTPSTIGKDMADAGIRFIKGENVGKGLSVSKLPEFYISEDTDKLLERSRLKRGDVLVIIAGATTGLSSVVEADVLPANANQAVSFVRPLSLDHSHLVARWLSTEFAQRMIWMGAVQAAQPNLSMEDLGNIPIAVPPAGELDEILNEVTARNEQLDQLIEQADAMSELLQERRTALIAAAVTGKIDVREWKSPDED